jgi:hypothetical protein
MTENPYQSPKEVDERPPILVVPQRGAEVWRDGDLMVMHQDARLPDLCPLTGNRAAVREAASFVHAGMSHWAGLLGGIPGRLLIYWISRKVTIELPLSEAIVDSRRYSVWGVIFGLPIAFGLFLAAYFLPPQRELLMIGGVAVVLLAAGLANAGVKDLRVEQTFGPYVWFSGADPSYLDQLPKWKGLPVEYQTTPPQQV